MLIGFLPQMQAEDPCPVHCHSSIYITLGSNCQYILTPNDLLHYPPPTCSYQINIYDAFGNPTNSNVLTSTHVGTTVSVKVSNAYNSCYVDVHVTGNGGGPVAICDQNTQVSLNNNGTARVPWQTFDDGSYVGCGSVASIQVRRMTPGWCPPGVADDTQYRDYVEFCCEDAQGGPVKVMLRVTDTYGNYNECWAYVYVEDKLNPHIYCPPDIHVSCDYPIDLNNLSVFGTVQMAGQTRNPIYVTDPHYPNGGFVGYDGYVEGGGCGGNNLWIVESHSQDLSSCGQGVIYRHFTIEQTNYSCTQKIYIQNSNYGAPHIYWPQDVHLDECGTNDFDPAITGRPTWNSHGDCAMLLSRYEDEVFTVSPGSCFKILRKWSVIDWCRFDRNKPWQYRWDYTQVIALKSPGTPVLWCEPTEICPTSYQGCKGYINVSPQATDDCTPDSLMAYHWCIDLFNDRSGNIQGQYDESGNTQYLSGYYPIGTHRVYWRVDDNCGHYSTCEMLVTVKDCKKPSPVCYNGLSTVVMPSTGTLDLWAKDFNASSFDNCTPEYDLIYSFSPNVNETSKQFDCNNIGTNEVRIYVTDRFGNQQYCTTYVQIDDNNGICPPDPIIFVSGTAFASNGDLLPGVIAKLDVNGINIANTSITEENGTFNFGTYAPIPTQAFDLSFTRKDDVRNGLSVLDLLLLQKHVVEIKEIEDPYRQMAADVNNDGSIDSRDLVEIRSVMLKRKDEFKTNDSWTFVNQNETNVLDADKNEFTLLTGTSSKSTINVVGVKMGDVNGNAKLDFVADRKLAHYDAQIVLVDEFLKAGETVRIKAKLEGVDQVKGFQFNAITNQSLVNVEQTTAFDGREMSTFIDSDGTLRTIFMPSQVDEVQYETEELMTIEMTVQKSCWLSEAIKSTSLNDGLVVNASDKEKSLELVYTSTLDEVTTSVLDVVALPNPFQSSTEIVIRKNAEESAKLTIANSAGHVIMALDIEGGNRVERVTLSRQDLPAAGLYHVNVQSSQESKNKRLVVMD